MEKEIATRRRSPALGSSSATLCGNLIRTRLPSVTFFAMLKTSAIAAVLLLATVINPSKKAVGADLGKESSGNHSSPTASIVNSETQYLSAAVINAEHAHWYTTPEWWLFLLGVPTLVFIGWQAKATADAAKATRDSILLQEIGLSQWVNIEKWEASAQRSLIPGNSNYGEVEIRFDIVNGSNFPLTMNDAEIVFYGSTTFNSGDNVFLAPHAPYQIHVRIRITMAQYTGWDQSILTIPIKGAIPHVGVLGKCVSQSFSGFLVLGRGRATFFQYEISMVPEEKQNVGARKAD